MQGDWTHEGSDDASEEPETVRFVLGVLDHGFPLKILGLSPPANMSPLSELQLADRGTRVGSTYQDGLIEKNAMCHGGPATFTHRKQKGTCKASSCKVGSPQGKCPRGYKGRVPVFAH